MLSCIGDSHGGTVSNWQKVEWTWNSSDWHSKNVRLSSQATPSQNQAASTFKNYIEETKNSLDNEACSEQILLKHLKEDLMYLLTSHALFLPQTQLFLHDVMNSWRDRALIYTLIIIENASSAVEIFLDRDFPQKFTRMKLWARQRSQHQSSTSCTHPSRWCLVYVIEEH